MISSAKGVWGLIGSPRSSRMSAQWRKNSCFLWLDTATLQASKWQGVSNRGFPYGVSHDVGSSIMQVLFLHNATPHPIHTHTHTHSLCPSFHCDSEDGVSLPNQDWVVIFSIKVTLSAAELNSYTLSALIYTNENVLWRIYLWICKKVLYR